MDNILDILSGAFGPSEADAASRSPAAPQDPQAALLKTLQVQRALMGLQDLARRQQQAQAMAPLQQQAAQQRVIAGQAKAQPGPQLSDILGTSGAPTGASPSRAPDVIFRGTTPGTGTPFFTNRPEAVGQMFGPEAQRNYEAQVAKAQPPAPAPTPGAAPSVPGESPTTQAQQAPVPPPQDLERHAQLVAAASRQGYTKAGAEAFADNLVPSMRQWKMQQDIEKKQAERKAQWLSSPVPAATIQLNAKGEPYYPVLNSDREPGSVQYAINSPQGKLVAATPLLLSHALQTVDEVSKINPKDKAAFQNFISAKIREWQGDPAQRAIASLLDPASAMAVGTLYSSGGAPTRGGVRMAEMFRNSFYSPGDSIPTVKEKLSVALGLLGDIAQRQNLHPRFIKEIQDAQKRVTAMGGSTAPQTYDALTDPSKAKGRTMFGSDGSRWLSDGQTWRRLQ